MAILKMPYTNLHEINLDWIIEQLNNTDGPVRTVNGKSGIVILTGEDIARSTSNPETVANALQSQGTSIQTVRNQIGTTPLPTTAQTITGAIAEHETDIGNLDTAIGNVNTAIGDTVLPTVAQTLTGAIAENAVEIANQEDLIGSTALPTTAQTITGAIAELDGDVTSLNSMFYFKSYTFNELSFSAGTTPGVRAIQQYTDISTDITAYGTPVSALITAIADSGKCNFQTFMYNNYLYLNGYSASANAMSDNSVTVRVLFKKS